MALSADKMKYVSLVVLILQTTAMVLLLRYSRTMKTEPNTPRYLSSTAVVVAEIVKIFTCLFVVFKECGFSIDRFALTMNREVLKKPMETFKVAVPAVLYVVQNNLLFLALSHLDAATYQVSYQLKILTTALFSVTMLNKQLGSHQWVSLFLLMAGVALVQLPGGSSATPVPGSEHSLSSKVIGLGAVIAACVTSGFSGVYFEKILKTTKTSLWIRNFQLAFFSILPGFAAVFISDIDAVRANGFFQGYNSVIWIVILLQAYGGLIIALVVKYADNILKGFATSLSIIISSITSYVLLGDLAPSLTFVMGASLVIASTFIYGYVPRKTDTISNNDTRMNGPDDVFQKPIQPV